MDRASLLARDFPAVLVAQGQGRISQSHAQVICDSAAELADAAQRAAYEERVLAVAETMTPARLRLVARRIAEEFQERTLAERHEEARQGRGVHIVPLADGMARLVATLPAVLAQGVHDRLSRMARGVKSAAREHAGDPADDRGVDALRADLLAELLLTGVPSEHDDAEGLLDAVTARVEITVPVLSLIGEETTPAELAGCGPIDIETARQLVGAASGWERVLTDPIGGAVLAVDRYRPNEDLRRHLRARDRRCRFPGCGVSAARCDLDHTIDAAHGGPTELTNLAALCRRHHVLKHHSRWQIVQQAGGMIEFTSPTGRVYRTHPPDAQSGGPPVTTVRFEQEIPAPF